MKQLLDAVLLFFYFLWQSLFVSVFDLVIPKRMKSVKNEIVLITGGNRGIGRQLALLYAKEGATVIIWNRDKESAAEVVEEIRKHGYPRAYSYTCDVSSRAEIFKLAATVEAEIGEVSILINNSGTMPQKPILENTQSDIEQTINVNLLAQFWTVQAFLPNMVKNNHGHVVSVGSVAGLIGSANIVAYSASKFGIRGFMSALRDEYSNTNIKFTNVGPFFVDNGFCKRPSVKFSFITPIISVEDAALKIMQDQRRDVHDSTCPAYFYPFLIMFWLCPDKIQNEMRKFFEIKVNPCY